MILKRMSVDAQNTTENNVDKLAGELKKLIDDDELTIANIPKIMLSLMAIVDHYPKLSGSQKKNLVLSTLRKHVIDHLEEEKPEYKDFINIIDMVLPTTIDLMVGIDNGEFSIHLKKGCSMVCPGMMKMRKKGKNTAKQ